MQSFKMISNIIIVGALILGAQGLDNEFLLYWNAPTFQCTEIDFSPLGEKYGFIQNTNDSFIGDKISLLYKTGLFPALNTDRNGTIINVVNGGVPQAANLSLHLEEFIKVIHNSIPNEDYDGVVVLDMENWRPIYRQNWSSLRKYQTYSIDLERQLHPDWSEEQIHIEAEARFNEYARIFMETTLLVGRNLRPLAKWGYYGFPYCFNYNPDYTQCDEGILDENDRINWMITESQNIHPSVYMPELTLDPVSRLESIIGRVSEAIRLREKFNPTAKILPYFWYIYRDTENFYNQDELLNSFVTMKLMGIEGVMMWGASADVSSSQKCQALYEYVDLVLGPALNIVNNKA